MNRTLRRMALLPAVWLCLSGGFLIAQQTPSSPPAAAADSAFQAQKTFATNLFNQNHHLEALPVLEQLLKEKPDDSDVMFMYGASLVDHSATLADDAAQSRELIRARQLLERAKELGNHSGLLMNLLEMIPANGEVHHDKNPAVAAAIQEGEGAFAKNDYDAAITAYSRAFTLDPTNYAAALFIGDSFFAKKDNANAGIWYDRAIALNPDIETAYRYEADMYARAGDLEKARKLSIQSVVAAPYTNATWRALLGWAKMAKVNLTPVQIKAAGGVTKQEDKHITITMDPTKTDSGAVWLAYQMSRALWQTEKFKKTYPGEASYRHSLAEETDALQIAASVARELAAKNKKITADPDVALLLRLSDAKMIEPYVLLSAPDQGIAADYEAYRAQHREQLAEYLAQFIVPEPAKN